MRNPCFVGEVEMGELAKPSVVADLLEKYGISPMRSLGQHFLVDGNVLRRILEAAELETGDTVLEIGPGMGTLTEELCSRAGRVVAVEMDRGLCSVLRDLLGNHPHLEIITGDALRVDLASLFAPDERVKVVSNLPYSVATPLLLRLLRELPQVRFLVITVQRELADRYLAGPGDAAYGAVSVKIQSLVEMRRLANVPPTVFFPPPRVESTVLLMHRKAPEPSEGEVEAFFLFLNACFASRRKMLANALGGGRNPYCPREAVAEALAFLGLPPTCRAEELSRQQLLALYRFVTKGGSPAERRRR